MNIQRHQFSAEAFESMLVSEWRPHRQVLATSLADPYSDAQDLLGDYIRGRACDERVFGAATALERYGRVFECASGERDWLIRGKPKQCYENAATYACVRDDVYYAEGYAIDPEFPIPIEHAWLVSLAGEVIDPTWSNGANHAYFGIAFKPERLMGLMNSDDGRVGVLFQLYRMGPRRAVLSKSGSNGPGDAGPPCEFC